LVESNRDGLLARIDALQSAAEQENGMTADRNRTPASQRADELEAARKTTEGTPNDIASTVALPNDR
jgi:hypothetical protein